MGGRQNAQGFAKPTRVFGGYAFSLSLAGGGDVTALAFNTAKAAGLDGDSDGPVLVARSVDDAPFRTMTLTANAAPYPTASVNSVGETLVTWNRQTLYPQTPTSTAEIAIAAPHAHLARRKRSAPSSRRLAERPHRQQPVTRRLAGGARNRAGHTSHAVAVRCLVGSRNWCKPGASAALPA